MLSDLQDPALRRAATNPERLGDVADGARKAITIVKPATGTPDEADHR